MAAEADTARRVRRVQMAQLLAVPVATDRRAVPAEWAEPAVRVDTFRVTAVQVEWVAMVEPAATAETVQLARMERLPGRQAAQVATAGMERLVARVGPVDCGALRRVPAWPGQLVMGATAAQVAMPGLQAMAAMALPAMFPHLMAVRAARGGTQAQPVTAA
jgi:hypothetical protein